MVQIYDNRVLLFDTETGFKASELTIANLEKQREILQLVYHQDLDLVLPEITGRIRSVGTYKLTNFLVRLKGRGFNTDGLHANIKKALDLNNTPLTDEEIEEFLTIPMQAVANSKHNIEKDVLRYCGDDPEVKRVLEKRVINDSVSYPHINASVPRNSENYELNVRLPEIGEILNIRSNQDLPRTNYSQSIGKLYPSLLYRTQFIGPILTTRDMATKRSQMALAVEELKYEYDLEGVSADMIIRSFEEIPLQWVTGSPENDAVGILDFEQKFADNLDAFIKYHTRRFIKDSNPNLDDAAIEAQAETHLATGDIPLRLQMYLAGLIRDICYQHYYHTGNIAFVQLDADDDEDEISFDGEDGSIKKRKRRKRKSDDDVDDSDNMTEIVSRTGKSKFQIDLDGVVFDYLKRASEVLGYQAFIEGIVKLTRMNEHKVSNLIVGQSYTLAVNLNSAQIETKDIQDLTNFELETDEYGASMYPSALAYVDFRGSQRITSYPFIVLAFQDGQTNGNEGRTYSTISLFDIVKAYVDGQRLFVSVELKNGKFQSDVEFDGIREITLNALREKRYRTHVEDKLVNWAITNRVPKITGTSWFGTFQDEVETIDTSDFLSTIKATPQELRNITVQNGFNTIFSKDSESFESDNFIELLNWYKDTLFNTHLKGYNNLIQGAEPNQPNVTNIAAVHLFTDGAGVPITEDYPEPKAEPYKYKTLTTDGRQLVPLLDAGKNKVGYISLVAKQVFQFTAIGEEGGGTVIEQTQDLDKFYLRFLEIVLAAKPGSTFECNHFVATPQTVAKIMNRVSTNLGSTQKDFTPIAIKRADVVKLLGGFDIQDGSMTIYSPKELPVKAQGAAQSLLKILPFLIKAALALDTESGIEDTKHKLFSEETHAHIYSSL